MKQKTHSNKCEKKLKKNKELYTLRVPIFLEEEEIFIKNKYKFERYLNKENCFELDRLIREVEKNEGIKISKIKMMSNLRKDFLK